MEKKKQSEVKSSTGTHLTEEQVRRLAKPKKGFEPFVQRLTALVSANADIAARCAGSTWRPCRRSSRRTKQRTLPRSIWRRT